MKFTLNWLKQHIDLHDNVDISNIADTLISLGFEVENIIDRGDELSGFVVARILETTQHPNADKLKICKVDTGSQVLQIVCGASNARAGINVALANIGSIVPNGKFAITSSKIRDVVSEGMLCSAKEMLLADDIPNIIYGDIVELLDDAPIGQPIAQYCNIDDPIIDIAITPNRGDAMSVYGIARELAAKNLGTLHIIDNTDHASHSPQNAYFLRINNVRNTKSPDWLTHMLQSVGIKPISAIVDIVNYVGHSLGQPLHCYDAASIGDLSITRATAHITFIALNEKICNIDSGDIIVHDRNAVHSLGGIIGSKYSSCKLSTTSILLEAAVFDPIQIRETAARFEIITDASMRFERGVDPAMTKTAILWAAKLITLICGGERGELKISTNLTHANTNGSVNIGSDVNAEGGKTAGMKSLIFELSLIEKKLGFKISKEEVNKILLSFGFGVTDTENNDSIIVTIPTWRHDVAIPEDIIEEIIRHIGFNALPDIHMPLELNSKQTLQARPTISKDILSSLGYHEVITWSFVDQITAETFSQTTLALEILNPISEKLNYLRYTAMQNLIGAIKRNQMRAIPDFPMFEVGPSFIDDDIEVQCLTGIRSIVNLNQFHHQSRVYDFYTLKGEIDLLLSYLPYKIDNNTPQYYHPDKSARILLGKTVLGYFGYIHPNILLTQAIGNDVLGFEIYIDNLPKPKGKLNHQNKYLISDYPIVKRDFSFLFHQTIDISKLLTSVCSFNQMIKNCELFDLYNMQDGALSIAISVMMQSDSSTLTDNVISELYNGIIIFVQKNFNGVLRGPMTD